jgi:hypothetical protein
VISILLEIKALVLDAILGNDSQSNAVTSVNVTLSTHCEAVLDQRNRFFKRQVALVLGLRQKGNLASSYTVLGNSDVTSSINPQNLVVKDRRNQRLP